MVLHDVGWAYGRRELYYDANTNGTVDVTDILLATGSTDTNGMYLFSSLPDGTFLAAVDIADTDLPTGYTITSPDTVSADLRLPVALFVHGRLAVLEAIRRQEFDVWSCRPVVSRWEKMRLMWRCWWQIRRGKPFGRPT